MSSVDPEKSLGKEVVHGIFGALAIIVVCVSIGSFIAQSLSHGEGHGGADHGEAGAQHEAPQEDGAAKE